MIPWPKPTSHRSGSSPNLFPRLADWEVEATCIRDYCIQSFVVLRPNNIATSRLHAEKLSSRWLLAAFHLLPSRDRLTETVCPQHWSNFLWDNRPWPNLLWGILLWDNLLFDNLLWDNPLWHTLPCHPMSSCSAPYCITVLHGINH